MVKISWNTRTTRCPGSYLHFCRMVCLFDNRYIYKKKSTVSTNCTKRYHTIDKNVQQVLVFVFHLAQRDNMSLTAHMATQRASFPQTVFWLSEPKESLFHHVHPNAAERLNAVTRPLVRVQRPVHHPATSVPGFCGWSCVVRGNISGFCGEVWDDYNSVVNETLTPLLCVTTSHNTVEGLVNFRDRLFNRDMVEHHPCLFLSLPLSSITYPPKCRKN